MKNLRTEKFDIDSFQEYVKTYKERHPDNQNIMFQDMLYGMGLAIDKEKYHGYDGFNKFVEWISESYRLDDYDDIMNEIWEAEKRVSEEIANYNDEILNELRKTLDDTYIENIRLCLQESEADGKLEIVDEPSDIMPQEEDWDSFDHVLVDQYRNGGYSGDDYAGYIYIPIGGGRYLKSHYSM